MASKKDLIDAQGYSRRRLLTAFISGAPGGKELEPKSPLKAVIAGIALSVMVIMGSVFYGLIKSGLPDQWENNRLVLVTDTGARYVSLNGVLYPVLNATSARLLVPAGEFSVVSTDSATIARIPIGPAVGILGAPDDVPTAANLYATAWTACVADGGVTLSLPGDPLAQVTASGAVVISGGSRFVVAEGFRYVVPAANADSILRAVGLADSRVSEVDSRWLNLFEDGGTLEPLVVERAGEQISGSNLIIGTVLQPQGSTNRFLVTPAGELAALTPFAYQMYLLGTGALLGGERAVAPGELANMSNAADRAGGQFWPTEQLAAVSPSSGLCATLQHDAGGLPVTALATTTSEARSAEVFVAPRGGALVAAGGSGQHAARSVQLIDQSGTAFPIPAADAEVLSRLGYDGQDVSVVTSAWMQFFAAGPELSIAAAGRTPVGQWGEEETGEDLEPALPDSTGGEQGAAPAEEGVANGGGASLAPSASPAALAPASISADATGPGQCEAGVVNWNPSAPSALSLLQTDASWNRVTGEGVIVAIVDSGIDASHPQLKDAVIGGINLVPDAGPDAWNKDDSGHGTAVAGVVAAQRVEQSGVVGLAPGARLLSVRIMQSDSEKSREDGFGPEPRAVAQGIRWAVDNGAHIIGVSLSVPADLPEIREATAYAVESGVLVVASAGNRSTSDTTADSPRYPAAYPGVMGVAAADRLGLVTTASIHGPHVDIAAPGSDISTTQSQGGNCTYALDGPQTSFATAYAAAAAALVMEAHPEESVAQIQYRLMATATRANPDQRSDAAGWGVIQPYEAMTLLAGASERGPKNPVAATAPGAILPVSTSLEAVAVESPIAETHTAMVRIGAILLVVLATLGVFIAKLLREDLPEEQEQSRPGLLDDLKSSPTKIV